MFRLVFEVETTNSFYAHGETLSSFLWESVSLHHPRLELHSALKDRILYKVLLLCCIKFEQRGCLTSAGAPHIACLSRNIHFQTAHEWTVSYTVPKPSNFNSIFIYYCSRTETSGRCSSEGISPSDIQYKHIYMGHIETYPQLL